MKQKRKMLSRILSFALVFVFLFSESGLSVAAAGLNDDVEKIIISNEATIEEEVSADIPEIEENAEIPAEEISAEEFEEELTTDEAGLGEGETISLTLGEVLSIEYENLDSDILWTSFTATEDGRYYFNTLGDYIYNYYYYPEVTCDLYSSLSATNPIAVSFSDEGVPSSDTPEYASYYQVVKEMKTGETVYVKLDTTRGNNYNKNPLCVYVSKLAANSMSIQADTIDTQSVPYGFETAVCASEYSHNNKFFRRQGFGIVFSTSNDFSALDNCFADNNFRNYGWPEQFYLCEAYENSWREDGYKYFFSTSDVKGFAGGTKLYYRFYSESQEGKVYSSFLNPLSEVFEVTAGDGVEKTAVSLSTPEACAGYINAYAQATVNNPSNETIIDSGYSFSADGKDVLPGYEEQYVSIYNNCLEFSSQIKYTPLKDYESIYVRFYVKVLEGTNPVEKTIETDWVKVTKKEIHGLDDILKFKINPGTGSVSITPDFIFDNEADRNGYIYVSAEVFEKNQTESCANRNMNFYESGYGNYSAEMITGLQPDTEYVLKLSFENGEEYNWSEEYSFTTKNIVTYDIADMPDEALRELILGNADAPITSDVLEKKTDIYLYDSVPSGKIIKNLKGIELLPNLNSLSILYQDIEDISVLSGMTGLTSLQIGECNVDKLPDLSALTHLASLNLNGNLIPSDEITAAKLPSAFATEENIASIKDNQRKPVETIIADKYYSQKGSVKFYFEMENVRYRRSFDVAITINGVEYKLSPLISYNSYVGGYYIFEENELVPGKYDYSLSATENGGGQTVKVTGSFTVEEFDHLVQDVYYCSPQASSIYMSVYFPFSNSDGNTAVFTILDEDGNVVGKGNGSSYDYYPQYGIWNDKRFKYSYQFQSMAGIEYRSYGGNVKILKKMSSGMGDLKVEIDGKTIVIEDCVAFGSSFLPVITSISNSYEQDSAGDYFYASVFGTAVDYDSFYPVLEKKGVALTEFVWRVGNTYKLKKKAGFISEGEADVNYVFKDGKAYDIDDNAKHLSLYSMSHPLSFVYNPKTKKFTVTFSSDYPMNKATRVIIGKGSYYDSSMPNYGSNEVISTFTLNSLNQKMEIDVPCKDGSNWEYPVGEYGSYYAVFTQRDEYGYENNDGVSIKCNTSGFYGYSTGYTYSSLSYGSVFEGSTTYSDFYTTNDNPKADTKYKITLYEGEEPLSSVDANMVVDDNYGYLEFKFSNCNFDSSKEYYVTVYTEGEEIEIFPVNVIFPDYLYAFGMSASYTLYKNQPVVEVYLSYLDLDNYIDKNKITYEFYTYSGEKITSMTKIGEDDYYRYFTGWPEDAKGLYAKILYNGKNVKYTESPKDDYIVYYANMDYSDTDAEFGMWMNIADYVAFTTENQKGYIGTYSNQASQYTVNIYDNFTDELLDTYNVKKCGTNYFTKTNLANTLKKDPNLNNLYKIEIRHSCLENGYTITENAVISISDYQPSDTKVTGVSISPSSVIMAPGESKYLTAEITPAGASTQLTWTSNNESVVTVSSDGHITAVNDGKAEITVKTENGKEATCTVIVRKAVEKLTIEKSEDSLEGIYVGNVYRFPVSVEPAENIEFYNIEVSEYFGDGDTTQNISITDKVASDGYVEFKCLSAGTSGIRVKIDSIEMFESFTVEDNTVQLISTVDASVIGTIKAIKGQPVGKLPAAPYVDGYEFVCWSSIEDGSKPVDEKTIFANQWKIYAYYVALEDTEEVPAGVKIIFNDESEYTGAAVKPTVKVMYGSSVLTSKDYSVSYKNNTAAYVLKEGDSEFNAAKAPTVIVKGKGNFVGTYTSFFTIKKHKINASDVVIDSSKMFAYKNGKAQKLKPSIKWGKTTLKEKKDYTLNYAGDCKEAGSYKVAIEGIGNFEGTAETTVRILDKSFEKLASKLSVSFADKKQKKCTYTGEEIKPEVVVKDGKKTLTLGEDYQVSYADNILPGKGKVIVSGTNAGYSGVKILEFAISGAPVSKAKISGITAKTFTGSAIELEDLTLGYKGVDGLLVEGKDYSVSYSNNVNAGKATVTITGLGYYTGTVKKTFKINPMPASEIEIADITEEYSLIKSGCKPSIRATATFGATKYTLKEGKDYTLSYKNNKAVADSGATKKPSVVATFKGNFKGKSAEKYFVIVPTAISTLENISVKDVIDNGKANNWNSKISVFDENGTALKAGTDYEVTYFLGDKELTKADKVEPAEDSPVEIKAVIKAIETTKKGARGSYSGTTETMYRVWVKGTPANDISKANITINNQYFTGKSIEIEGSDFSKAIFKVSKTETRQLIYGVDYKIVGYQKNVAKGKATAIIKGIGSYSGTLKVTFKIVSRPLQK